MVELTRIIREFIASLSLSGAVISLSDDGQNTTLVLENSYHLREYMNLTVDGTAYEVVSVDAENNTAVVSGVIVSASSYAVPNPFFFHGSNYIAGVDFDIRQDEERLPMFYMEKPIRERWYGKGSNLGAEPDFYFLIADWANYQDWVADDYDSKRLLGLRRLAWAIRQSANDYRLFGDIDRFDIELMQKLGDYARGGADNSIFNHTLTGIGIRVTIPIYKNCC